MVWRHPSLELNLTDLESLADFMGGENLGMVLDQSVSYFLLYLFLQEKCLKIDFKLARRITRPSMGPVEQRLWTEQSEKHQKNPHLTAHKLHQIMLQWCITFLLL